MKHSTLLVNMPSLIVALLLLHQTPLLAQEGQSDESALAAPAPPAAAAAIVSVSDVLDMLKKQQSQLDDQEQQLIDQKQQLIEHQKIFATLQGQAETELTAEKDKNAKQAQRLEEQRQAMVSMQTQIDQINQKKSEDMTEEDIALRSRMETIESSIQASQEAANTTFDENSFPNSTMIPGTNAAMRMGGFVKMNIVETFDPLGNLDRFIAGTIPVPQQSTTPRTTMTVSQSRLN